MGLKKHLASCSVFAMVFALSRGIPQQPGPQPDVLSRPRFGLPVNNGYPTLARAGNGTLWLAWVSNRERDRSRRGSEEDLVRSDHILLKKRDASGWSQEIPVSTGDTMNSDPTLAADNSGVWVIWSGRVNGDFDLFARRVSDSGQTGEVRRITQTPGVDASPQAAVAPDGSIWLVWGAFRDGANQILAASGKNGAFSEPTPISGSAAPAWRPAITISKSGVVSIAWDGGVEERYSAYFRQFAGGNWTDIQRVPTDPNLDAYAPRIAAGRGESVWLAYAQNPERAPEWGLRGWRPPPAPRPTTHALEWTGSRWRDTGLAADNADMPSIVASENGGVEIVLLRLKSHLNFRLWLTRFAEKGWTEPEQLDVNEEEFQNVRFPGAPKARVDQRPSLVAAGDRIVMAYERGTGVFENRQIAVREFAAAGPASDAATLYRHPSIPAARRSKPARPAVPRVSGYSVYFGELHMHLLMDDGWTGTADQYYSFARDRWLLDFAAYTPHAESNKLLASEIGLVQRTAAMFNQPGRFIGISGWEWTQGDFKVPQEGHKHVINETDDQPFFSSTEATSDSARELTARMKGTTGVMFAHHVARGSAGGTNFDAIDTSVEPDVEIASHWGRFEFFRNPGHTRDEVSGSSVQDAWKRQLRLGVVGGSDNHDLFMERPTALTAVLADKLDRRSLFDALRKRRCYATTGERIVLDVRVNGQPMGSVVQSALPPLIAVKAGGAGVVEKIEIIKFYRGAPEPFPAVYAVSPNSKEAAFQWRDLDFRADSAYYVRVTQRADPRLPDKKAFGSATGFPNEMAWSSPVWVSKR
ncbi:MAG: DUF3604 domain-containing protein [Acidobacteria bacterium]|nr:DUF3604 domain-containing protein [Acidobacteriota bacterium]